MRKLRLISMLFLTGLFNACSDSIPTDPPSPPAADPSFDVIPQWYDGVGIKGVSITRSGELWYERTCGAHREMVEKETLIYRGDTVPPDTIRWLEGEIFYDCPALMETGKVMVVGGIISVFAVSESAGIEHIVDFPADLSVHGKFAQIPSDGYILLKTTPYSGCQFVKWWTEVAFDESFEDTYRVYPNTGINQVFGMFMCGGGNSGGGGGNNGGDGPDCPPWMVICED